MTAALQAQPPKRIPRARALRGTPDATRDRLVAVAARVFNRSGYHGTDSNRLAQEAGYAAGTFYKHFADKREVFLAAYEAWVTAEWRAIGATLAAGGRPRAVAKALVAQTIRLHRRWKGFRASMLALAATDAAARRVYRAQRRFQLERMRELRVSAGKPPHPRAHDALLLYTLERSCDAIAQGEARELGVPEAALADRLVAIVERYLA
jgi:AcrR family transcriptional regulator